jgi:hypothetical protein
MEGGCCDAVSGTLSAAPAAVAGWIWMPPSWSVEPDPVDRLRLLPEAVAQPARTNAATSTKLGILICRL